MTEKEVQPSDPEAGLVSRLRSGHHAAIADLYNLYFDRLHSLVSNQVDRKRDMAEDIVQDTFVVAMKSGKGFSNMYTRLCSIAYDKVADYYRRQARQRKHIVSGLEVDTVAVADSSGGQPQLNSLADSAETRQAVSLALERLPRQYRQALTLKCVEMSVQEIS